MRNYLYENIFTNSNISYLTLMVLLVFFLQTNMLAQDLKAAPLYEPVNPSILSHPDIDRWSYIPEELQVSFGSIDERYDRNRVPFFRSTPVWKGTAWRGEKINIQFVLWTNRGARQVQVIPKKLKNEKNQIIDPSNLQARFVRYALSDDYFYGCNPNTQRKSPILVADILDNLDCLDIPANTTRPVWLTIDIPSDAAPGMYQGTITIKAKGENDKSLMIHLELLTLELPPPSA